jgi:hypothetical protein
MLPLSFMVQAALRAGQDRAVEVLGTSLREGWDAGVIDQVSADLRAAFPGPYGSTLRLLVTASGEDEAAIARDQGLLAFEPQVHARLCGILARKKRLAPLPPIPRSYLSCEVAERGSFA